MLHSTYKKELLERLIVPTLTEEKILLVTNPIVLEELLKVAENLEMYELCSILFNQIKKQK